MKKLLFVIFCMLAFTSCNIKQIDIAKENMLDIILNEDNTLINTISTGYKYYIPNGVTLIGRNKYNEILYSKGDYYYLYVDFVSYYNKVKLGYEENEYAYYSKKLNYKDKEGYIEITKINDKYFIEMMYNYSKIEAYVKEANIDEAVLNSSYILSSIKINDILMKSNLKSFEDKKKEEYLNIFVPKREEGTFLEPEIIDEIEEAGKESEE